MTARRSLVLFLVTLLAAIVHLAWVAGEVPETLASHFGTEGRADGTSDRTSFIALNGLILFMFAATFGGFGWLAPRLPDASVSIPHRDYWLAPGRRDRTLAWISARVYEFGAITLLYFAANTHLIVLANRHDPPRLPGAFGPLLVVYLGIVLGWTVMMVTAFRRPRDAAGE